MQEVFLTLLILAFDSFFPAAASSPCTATAQPPTHSQSAKEHTSKILSTVFNAIVSLAFLSFLVFGACFFLVYVMVYNKAISPEISVLSYVTAKPAVEAVKLRQTKTAEDKRKLAVDALKRYGEAVADSIKADGDWNVEKTNIRYDNAVAAAEAVERALTVLVEAEEAALIAESTCDYSLERKYRSKTKFDSRGSAEFEEWKDKHAHRYHTDAGCWPTAKKAWSRVVSTGSKVSLLFAVFKLWWSVAESWGAPKWKSSLKI